MVVFQCFTSYTDSFCSASSLPMTIPWSMGLRGFYVGALGVALRAIKYSIEVLKIEAISSSLFCGILPLLTQL